MPTRRRLPCRCAAILIAAAAGGAFGSSVARAADTEAAMGALKLAKHYYDNKEFKKAARRFHEAYAIDPNPAFLYNAARAEQRAFMLDEAERDFREVLKHTKDDTMRQRTGVRLQEIADYRKKLDATATDAAKANAAAAKARRDAERAKRDAEKARREAAKAKKEAAVAKKAGAGRGVGGMTLKEKVLYGVSAGLLVTSAVLYGAALSTRDTAIELEGAIDEAGDPRNREALIVEHRDKVNVSAAERNTSLVLLGLGAGLAWYTYAWGGPDEPGTAALGARVWLGGRGLALTGRF